MKICRIRFQDFQQFKDVDLDFTHPGTGEPLEKICFIGANGAGKSTLLNFISNIFFFNFALGDSFKNDKRKAMIEIKHEDKYYYFKYAHDRLYLLNENFEKQSDLHFKKEDALINFFETENTNSILTAEEKDFLKIAENFKADNSSNILIYVPPEAQNNKLLQIEDLPETNLNEALVLFEKFPFFNLISEEKIDEFWKLLIYHIKKRENDFREFESLPENQIRTVKEVREAFNNANPDILKSLSIFWNNKMLNKIGLEFDYEGAKNPVQLTDNLKAYIRLKSNKKIIKYYQLSTGTRNLIFKLGYIYALYFNRKIKEGVLLIDEPENSLFPDFIYDIVSIYQEITHNTQIFMATHSPIVASQFQPFERFIFEFENSSGNVNVRSGVTPIGDDPNDILIKDFGIRSILGKEGVDKWERYIELRTLIPLEKNSKIKNEMIEEFMFIGNEYNFEANAIS